MSQYQTSSRDYIGDMLQSVSFRGDHQDCELSSGSQFLKTNGFFKPKELSPSSSWVDLTKESAGTAPALVPFCSSSDYLLMLKEAQSECSARSSARVSPVYSLISIGRSSPLSSISSPKSPNSPNTELASVEDKISLQGVFINQDPELDVQDNLNTSIWTSHSKAWSLPSSKSKKVKDISGEVVVTLFMSHMLAFGLGVILGYWVLRRRGEAGLRV
eukprot:GFUD01026672.1.p1 GENE.GFUD01026672.1~~GFUD01026672.1.p1  ORF type:complete len:216 (-),score=61.39 GFUD01026672.1:113-760(-)